MEVNEIVKNQVKYDFKSNLSRKKNRHFTNWLGTLENVKWELETRWELPSVRGTGLQTGRWKIFTAEKKLIKIISTTKS